MESDLALREEIISDLQKCFVSKNPIISSASQEILQRFQTGVNKVTHSQKISGLSFRYQIRFILKSREKPELDFCAIGKLALMEQSKPFLSDSSMPCFMIMELMFPDAAARYCKQQSSARMSHDKVIFGTPLLKLFPGLL